MKTTLEFLSALRRNNTREWFADHKDEYRRVQAETEELAARLIEGIGCFDSSVKGLMPKDCTYRIYRDTRFSKDKSPYKTHIGIYICPGGKKSGRSGYYFHIEPADSTFSAGGSPGSHLLSVGLYMPEPTVLKSVREEILFNGEELQRNIDKTAGFVLNTDNSLKRVPSGFPADSPFAEYLKLRDIYLEKRVDEDFLLTPDLIDSAVESFASAVDFNRQLNRAVDYALENM